MQNALSEIPNNDFVYLSDIDPTILQSVRYYSLDNFVGRRIEDYNKATIILSRQAALKLKDVQKDVGKNGYKLVVYDAYRPQKAVDAFMSWGKDIRDAIKKDEYYPYIDKDKVFDLGYVASKYGRPEGALLI